jgi:hypothetical protein
MLGINWLSITLDFQASGLSELTYPFGIGLAKCRADRCIEVWSTLISPTEERLRHRLWNPSSEQIHGLTRADLIGQNTPAQALAAARVFAAGAVLYCDGGEHDIRWFRHLAHAAATPADFLLTDREDLFRDLPDLLARSLRWRAEQSSPHRGGADAIVLMKAIPVGIEEGSLRR